MGNSETRRKAAQLRKKQIQAKTPSLISAESTFPRFVADVMLGKLAKWLRIAGYDVLYSNTYTDDELISISRSEDRILLSMDSRLLIRKDVNRFIFLQSWDLKNQIKHIWNITRPCGFPSRLSRCLSCNEILSEVSQEHVRTRVPDYVYKTQTHFKICPKCRKVFWQGTHIKSVLKILESLFTDDRPLASSCKKSILKHSPPTRASASDRTHNRHNAYAHTKR